MLRRLAVPLLLLAPMARAEEPLVVIEGPSEVPIGAAVILDASGSKSDPDRPLQWQVVRPAKVAVNAFDQDGRKRILAILSPLTEGEYTVVVTAYGTVDKELKAKSLAWEFTAGKPKPKPDPKPDPDVPPGPVSELSPVAKAFLSSVVDAYADSWDTNATVFAAGGSAADAFTASNQQLTDKRAAAARTTFLPLFEKVLPAGTEPKDAAQRQAMVGLTREWAKALRELKPR